MGKLAIFEQGNSNYIEAELRKSIEQMERGKGSALFVAPLVDHGGSIVAFTNDFAALPVEQRLELVHMAQAALTSMLTELHEELTEQTPGQAQELLA